MAPKEEWIKIRVDAADKARFAAQAEEEGLSLSSWMRRSLRMLLKELPPPAATAPRKKRANK